MNFLAPDDFPDDAYGWITNQAGHWMIGVVAAWALGGGAVAAGVVLIAMAAWEVRQRAIGGHLRDGLADWTFVALGVAWTVLGASWPLALILILCLAAGAVARK